MQMPRITSTVTVIRMRITDNAAIAGSMLSRRPIHISRGRVMALTLVMNRVTPISSHDRMKESSAAVTMPNLMLGTMICVARSHTEAPRPRAARSMRRSIWLSATRISTVAKGTVITECAMATPSQVS